MTLSFLFGSKNFCKLLCVSEKFLFCTDTTESIGWPSPGLRFDLVLGFWLAWSTLDTNTGQESIPHRSTRAPVLTVT